MFDIILQTNLSEPEKLEKSLTDIITIPGTLKDGSSILDPTILIEGIDPIYFGSINYMTIPTFGRSYFVKGLDVVNNRLLMIRGHVDVLSTYKTQIRTNKAIINRQEQKPIWNLYLNDGSLRIYQNPQVVTKKFPNPFSELEIVLIVAGG